MSTRVRRTVGVVVALAMSGSALAGCGARPLSELHASEAAAATAVVSEEAPGVDPAAKIINGISPDADLAAQVPAEIRKSGLEFSTSQGYPPMEMFASDEKTLVGIDPSLGRAIARVLGLRITMNDADFNAQIPGLLTGRYHLVMSSMTDNKERQQKVTFVDYVQAGAAVQVLKGNPAGIQGPSDLCGLSASVVDNGSSLAVLQGYDKDCKKAGKPAIKILRFTGDQDALLALRSGRAKASVTDYIVAAGRSADPKQKVDTVPLKGTEVPWGIAMKPSQKKLIKAVQGALDSLIKSGDYGKILGAYKMQRLAIPKATINGGTE